MRKRKMDSTDSEEIPCKKSKLIPIFDINFNKSLSTIKLSDFGEMNYECPHCSAIFWKEEHKKLNCCKNGKIHLSPLSDYDPELKKSFVI